MQGKYFKFARQVFEEICNASIRSFKYLQSYFFYDLNCDNLKQDVSVEHFPFVTLWHLCWMQSVWQGQTWSLTRCGFVLLCLLIGEDIVLCYACMVWYGMVC